VRIALVAPPWIAVPPPGYGGIEWVTYLLAEELVALGHDVTLYATGDSRTSAELVSFLPTAAPARMHDPGIDAHHMGEVFRHIRARAAGDDGYDVVHDHNEWLGAAFAHTLPMPVVFTHHNALVPERKRVYEAFFDDVTHVCLSAHQKATWPALADAAVVPNAIDLSSYAVRAEKDDFLLCISRIHPDKGNHLALEAGRRSGREVLLVGKIDPGEGRRYFAEQVEPLLGDRGRYLGEVDDAAKHDLLSRAAATLFPIQWDEPFGLVMAESMASGTPCIAFARGAAPEVIDDGVTGFLVSDLDELVAAIGRLGEIDPLACRRHVEQHHSPQAMATAYVAVYERALAGRLTPA
jgi:glycosyltransferase involved in cell wall biosynthesis